MHEDMEKEMVTTCCALQETSLVVDRTGGSMDAGKLWDNGVTYVEEESWSEAVHVT